MRRLTATLIALLAVSACAHDRYRYGHDGYGYQGDDWSAPGEDLYRLDPWLEETREGQAIVARSLGRDFHPEAVRDLNIRFRQFADMDRDQRLTDEEIRMALVRCAAHGWSW